MTSDLKYQYHRIHISKEVMDRLRTQVDPRPIYGPPAPLVPHSCNCSYCDMEGELE